MRGVRGVTYSHIYAETEYGAVGATRRERIPTTTCHYYVECTPTFLLHITYCSLSLSLPLSLSLSLSLSPSLPIPPSLLSPPPPPEPSTHLGGADTRGPAAPEA
eukprot:scaffold145893_cov34-Tisochrysis_lutea.AAC.1